MTHVHLGIPYTRPFWGDTVKSLLLARVPGMFGVDFIPYQSVDVGRNTIVEHFLAGEATHLWFVDNDATFHPQSLERMLAHDVPFVCGTMYTRALPPTPTIGLYNGQTKEGKHVYRYGESVRRILEDARKHNVPKDVDNTIMYPLDSDSLLEVDGCGMHYCLIRRDVIEALSPPYFLMGGNKGAGEDFYFCQKVQKAGFPIYWDTGIHTGHVLVDGKDFGLRELLSYATYVDETYGVKDDDHRWSV